MLKVVLYFCVFVFSLNSFSQCFRNVTNINGFSSKSIYDIEYDKNGILWIATYNSGLYRYDGINLEQFVDTSDFGSYHSRKIFIDNGVVFNGTSNGLFKIANNVNTKLNLFKVPQQITDIKKLGNNDYLITSTLGFYRYKNLKLKPIDSDSQKHKTRKVNLAIISNADNTKIYTATHTGLFKLSNDLLQLEKIEFQGIEKFRAYRGKFINDTLYLATSEGLLLIRDDKLLKVYNDSVFDTKAINYIFKPINKPYIWVFQKGKMYKFKNGKVIENYGVEDGLSEFEVSKVIEDKEGNLIIASRGGGLCYFIEDYIYRYNVGNVNKIHKINDTLVYYSNKTEISKLNLKTKVSSSIINFESQKIKGVIDFVVDANNVVWVYLETNFLNGYKNSKLIKSINFNKIHPKGFLSKMNLTSNYGLWLSYGDGAENLDLKNFKTKKLTYKNKVFINFVQGIKEIGNDLFILTGTVIFKKSKPNTEFENALGLRLYANSMEQDYLKNYWFVSDRDFFLFKDKKLLPFQNKLNFSTFEITSTNIYKNYLVGYAEGGIYLFNLKDYYNTGKLSALKFNLHENFNANLITTTSNFTDKKGNLYFGTENGIIKFNFTQALAKKQVLKIYLSNILLNYEKVNWENLNFKSVNNIPISPKFEHFQNNITFQLSNLNFFNSNNTLFQFKLIGLDKSFTKPSKTNQINYSNLPFGKYEFVAKAHRDGFEKTSDILFYRFEILPAFYQTLWFKLLVIILIGVIVVLIFKYRTMQIKAKNKMLEKMVNQKTELLNVKITEVTELYNQIKSKNLTINESIEYAKYIQDSILKLNKPSTINSNIEINELIYLPKDTIGGDFYMIFNHNDLNFIVLADCTGHGVPGALLTVLSKSLLNQIILYDNVHEPHLILEKLNELFWNTFKNTNNSTETSFDSLSVSVLVLDYENNILVCSNSQMPFFIKSKNDIIEIKTKSSSINVNPLIAKYESETYNISDIESILLYSDGIIDQKGGVNSKKLYTTGLKNWLMNEYGNGYYLKKLEEFKKYNSQRDDIMLLNIKLRKI